MWMGQGHTRPALLSRRRIMACSCAAGHASHGLSASGHSSLRNDEGNAGAIGSCACANGQGEIESHTFLIGQTPTEPSGRSEAVCLDGSALGTLKSDRFGISASARFAFL